MDSSVINFTRNRPRRVQMRKAISFLFCKGIDRLDACQFGRRKLSKSCFFDNLLFFVDYFDSPFRHRHRFDGFSSHNSRFQISLLHLKLVIKNLQRACIYDKLFNNSKRSFSYYFQYKLLYYKIQNQIMSNHPNDSYGQGARNYDKLYDTGNFNQDQPVVPNPHQLTKNGICKKFIHGKCRQACPYVHDRSKIKPCDKFQNNGSCPYGDKCDFSHDIKICKQFMKDQCSKGDHCQFRHVYKSCPNYDMGFCLLGKSCKNKHIIRKLCWDYMNGYCEKGGKCPDHHPKIFVQQDFQQSKLLYKNLFKHQPTYYICNYCAQIGHKVTKCPKRVQIEREDVYKCGLCGNTHNLMDDCNFIV